MLTCGLRPPHIAEPCSGPAHRHRRLADVCPEAAEPGAARPAGGAGGAGAAAGCVRRDPAAAGGLHQGHPVCAPPAAGRRQAPAASHGQGRAGDTQPTTLLMLISFLVCVPIYTIAIGVKVCSHGYTHTTRSKRLFSL